VRSIAARLAVWYALAATATLAGLSVAGYFALQTSLINGLDLLNAAEFKQIQARLGSDYRTLSATDINQRIRQTTDYAAVLFFVDVHGGNVGTLFRSANLRGNTIPDLPGQHVFSTTVAGIGDLRSAEFLLPPFDVMIGTPFQPVRDVMHGYLRISIALAAIMLLVSSAIGFVLSHFALRPVRLIEETANHIRSDNLSERIATDNIDNELANLARLLNQMFDRLESSFAQIQRFTAEASHELKTPLSLLRLHAERLMIEGTLSPTQEETVHAQLEEVSRLNKIIEELLFISRAEAGAITLERKEQEPGEFMQGFAQDARVLCEYRGIRYSDTHEGDGTACFDAKWIRQVLLNILANALNVSPAGGLVTIRSVLSGPSWRVSLLDEGPGVEPQSLHKIFERFVRLGPQTAALDGGSGLGLAICRSIVELHQGRIWAEPGPEGCGLRVVFEVPRQLLSQDDAATAARLAASSGGAESGRHQQWHSD
jgi:two-component system heavy metal sensor histidine kinase CusS